jgi:hypothetical protein
MPEDVQSIPQLETLCRRCEGTGKIRDGGQKVDCDKCDGAGYSTTPFGKKVVELMSHNFRPMLEKTIVNR